MTSASTGTRVLGTVKAEMSIFGHAAEHVQASKSLYRFEVFSVKQIAPISRSECVEKNINLQSLENRSSVLSFLFSIATHRQVGDP